MLIVFCGIDGCGKSTYIDCLKKHMESNGTLCQIIDPMKKGVLSQALKKIPIASEINVNHLFDPTLISSAYALDMLYSMSKNEKNIFYLSHRYDLCCRSYAMVQSANINYIDMILSCLPIPNLTVYIKISPVIAYERLIQRNKKLSWKENIDVLTNASLYYDINFNRLRRNKIMIDNSEAEDFEGNMDAIKNKINELLGKEAEK